METGGNSLLPHYNTCEMAVLCINCLKSSEVEIRSYFLLEGTIRYQPMGKRIRRIVSLSTDNLCAAQFVKKNFPFFTETDNFQT